MASKKNLRIPGRYDRIREACDFIVAGAEEAGFDPDEVFRIQLACDEACTNIIEHAYGAENMGDIWVGWQIKKGAFVIELRDNGRPFQPEDVPTPLAPENLEELDELKVGGLGIHFMRTLMDEIRFSFNDKGNHLLMVKYLNEYER